MSFLGSNKDRLRTCQKIRVDILAGFSFLVLTLLTAKAFVPEISVDAASQTASQTVGPYTMSMANDSVATINITPTSSQAVYTATNNLSVTNTCSAGATITMTTNSTSSNSLTRSATNSDTLTKDIAATTTTGLDNNSWGYALNNSSTYYAVPKKGQTAATIYNASAAQASALTVPVKFGVKTDNNMPSGTYTNDVIYTMTPKSGCNSYSVTWNYDGGTAKSGATYPTSLSWGQTVNLSTLTPTKSGYTFAGWTNGTSTFTGSETAANINSSNSSSITVTAKWTSNCTGDCSEIDVDVNQGVGYSYTGTVKGVIFKRAGYYKLEVWGAQGGRWSSSAAGGYGGYAIGVVSLSANQSLYVTVGGAGTAVTNNKGSSYVNGGYNGGGAGRHMSSGSRVSTGGGATDISTKSHTVSLNSSTHRYEASTYEGRIIVAGGGGGCDQTTDANVGGSGGGYQGANGLGNEIGYGGTQTAGGGKAQGSQVYASGLGVGGTGVDSGHPGWPYLGGGGGYYGGGGGSDDASAGGGSGYIGSSSLLSAKDVTKQMYMYSTGCTSSSAESTKTTCTSSTGAHVANAANSGNGYAKITYLGT